MYSAYTLCLFSLYSLCFELKNFCWACSIKNLSIYLRSLIFWPLCAVAGSGTASTGWQSTSTTTWTSTVLTTRARRLMGAWSATFCSWSTTRATLPASTGCAASSAGSATVPAVPMDPCASQRSFSSSRPSPWASSSDPDMNTITSVSSFFFFEGPGLILTVISHESAFKCRPLLVLPNNQTIYFFFMFRFFIVLLAN